MKCVCGHDELIERLRQNSTSQSPEYVKAIVDLADCNDSLRARIAAMREALLDREWIHVHEIHGYDYIGDCSEHMECRSCNGTYPIHKKNCNLAALLKESEE